MLIDLIEKARKKMEDREDKGDDREDEGDVEIWVTNETKILKIYKKELNKLMIFAYFNVIFKFTSQSRIFHTIDKII